MFNIREAASRRRTLHAGIAFGVLCIFLADVTTAELSRAEGDWVTFGADTGSTKYSSLDQIDAQNVGDLDIAWRWKTPDAGIVAEHRNIRPGQFKATPLAVGGNSICQYADRAGGCG